jgi:SAM-dependent methyltransferase
MTSNPDALKASSARIYDYLLGGTENYAVDRDAAEMFLTALPNARNAARATRGFVLRAARFMAEQGISQFLDVGCGLPITPDVHEVVRSIHPDARVVYADNDPIVLATGQALRDEPGVVTVEGDLRKPAAMLANAELLDVLDLSKPLGVFTVAVWHFLPDDAFAQAPAELGAALAPGSYWALSHACVENLTSAQIKAGEALYKQTTNPVRARRKKQIKALLDGFELVPPGLVPLHEWHPQAGDPYPEPSAEALAAVGVLR